MPSSPNISFLPALLTFSLALGVGIGFICGGFELEGREWISFNDSVGTFFTLSKVCFGFIKVSHLMHHYLERSNWSFLDYFCCNSWTATC